MIEMFQTRGEQIIHPRKPQTDAWIDLTDPTEEELALVKPLVDIPEDVLVASKDIDEVPKLEKIDDANFLLIQTPRHITEEEEEETISGVYSIAPLAMMFTGDILITISEGKNDVTHYLKTKLKNFDRNRIIDTKRISQLILKMLLFNSKIYLRYLKAINQKIRIAQGNLEQSPSNEEIVHMMDLEKSLVYFSTSIHSNHVVIEKCAKRGYFMSNDDDKELMEDIIDENNQALATVRIYGRIIGNISNTFASIVSNNLNQTVKFLTSVTIVLMLPTLVASVYGMNVVLPFQESPFAFWITMGISGMLSLLVIVFFFRKKLF